MIRKQNLLSLIVLGFAIAFCPNSGGRELIDVSLEVPVTKRGAEGRQEAFDQAIESATKDLVRDMIGAEKVASSWDEIKPRILKSSTKYVVFIRGAPVSDAKNAARMQVQMRLSPDHLEAALREAGLYGGETVRVLPLVQVVESLGSRYVWWADLSDGRSANVAQGYFKRFFQQLNAQFKGKNVFVLDPTNTSFRMGLPATYRTEHLRREDQILLAQYLRADVVLSGRVEVSRARSDSPEHKIDYVLELWQVRTGRSLGEVSRQEVVGSDHTKAIQALMEQVQPALLGSLAAKLNDAVANGNLNLSVVKISVEGGLNPRQMAGFRRLLASVREIRVLRERLIEPYRLTFEGESTLTASDLAKVIQRGRFPGYAVEVASAPDNRLVLSVKAVGSASVQ